MLFQQLSSFLQASLVPVFVFDSPDACFWANPTRRASWIVDQVKDFIDAFGFYCHMVRVILLCAPTC